MTVSHRFNATRKRTPKLPPDRGFCQCAACGLYFLNVRAFDIHRVGPMNDRGCMPTPHMRDAGLELDPRGYWRLPKRRFGVDRRRALEAA